MLRIPKGNFGYIDSHKRTQALKTLIFFLIPLAVFVVGYVTTGGKENYFTILAVLGCLPACKELVNVFMFLKRHSIPADLYEQIHAHMGEMEEVYELTLTTYEETYPVFAAAVRGNEVVGYTSHKDLKLRTAEEHIVKTMKNNGLSGVHVHIFTDLKQFLERLDALAAKEVEELPFAGDDRYPGFTREQVIRQILLALSA